MSNSRLEITTQLKTRFASLHSNRNKGMALAVCGEAGIGKTWTIQQVLREAKISSFSVHATSSSSTLVRTLPIPKKFPVWAARILERLAKGEFVDAQALTDAWIAQLAGLAPIILHLEDLHEADAERLELWQGLARIVNRTRGVGLLVTSRSQAPEPFETLKLEPLSNQETRDLLETEVNTILPLEACDWIFARSAGNPLFALEYFRFLARAGFLYNDASRWHWRVPPKDLMPVTVEALIERQITEACQTSEIRDALESKAILDLNASSELWLEVSGLSTESLEESRAHLERRSLFFDGEFAHPLFREVSLKTTSLERKQNFARQALKALESEPEQAVQFVEDAKLEPIQAIELLKQAAEHATEAGRGVDASRFLARAVNYFTGEEQARLALEAARGLRQVDLSESARLADIVLAIRPDDPEAILFRAGLLATQGRMNDVETLLERLPESGRSGNDWLSQLLKLRSTQGDHTGVLEMCKAHPELLETTDPDRCYDIGWSMTNCGENAQAEVLAKRGLAQKDLLPEQYTRLTNLYGVISDNQGEYLQAEAYFTQALSNSLQTGQLRSIAAAYFNRAFARKFLGLYQDMTSDLEQAMRLCGELGDGKRYAHAQTTLARSLILFAQYERAEELLLESRATLERMGVSDYLIECEQHLCDLYLAWQSPHGASLALKYSQTALEHARVLGNKLRLVDTLFYASQAQASCGKGLLALEMSAQMFELLQTIDALPELGDAYFARATALESIGQRHEALEAFLQSVEATKSPPSAQIRWLEVDRLNHDLESARTRLFWFEERGLLGGANTARRYFPELEFTLEKQVLPASEHSPSRLEVLGAMQLRQDKKIQAIRGQKRGEFLAVLLEARIAGRTEVSQLELIDQLYPETLEQVAIAAIRQLVFQIRSSFNEGLIQTSANGYALGAVESDAELFLKNGDVQLWRGAYLEGISIQTQSDETVREAVHHALLTKLPAMLETEPSQVTRLCKILLEFDPYNLEVWKFNLQALRASNNYRGLNKRYLECRTQLLEIGEHLPERWNEFLEPASLI